MLGGVKIYISTSLYLNIKAAFLNGRGNDKNNITLVKSYNAKGKAYPYVSAQAVRKWIRRTVNHLDKQFSYYERINRPSLSKKERNNPEGLWIDPIKYIEDDLFGYSHPFLDTPHQDNKQHLNVTVANRLSPFQTTALICLPMTSDIAIHDGWVKPLQGTSLPFATEIMSGFFEFSATLDINRIGVFRSYGDIIELDPFYKQYYIDNNKLIDTSTDKKIEFRLANLINRRKFAIKFYYDSLLNLYGAAKSSMLASDLSPRIIITSILNSANNLFSGIVSSRQNGEIYFDSDKLLERLDSNRTILQSDIYIGYRSKTLKELEEKNLFALNKHVIDKSDGNFKILIVSPGQASKLAINRLEEML